MGWQRRSGIPSAPLFPALLTPSGMLPGGPHPHVHVLLGGCSWFSRRLSHSSDPNRRWGQQDVLGLPVGALCVQPGRDGSAPAWHLQGMGKRRLSPLSAWENCLLLPSCQSWPQELALAPAMQGELCGARSWHWVRGRTWCWSGAQSSAPEQHVMGMAGEQCWRQPGLPRDTAGTAERCHKVPEDAAGLSERCCRVLAVLCRMGMKCHRVPRATAGLSVVAIQGLCQQHCLVVQCSHGTSMKPVTPSLCPCPAELTPYTPHSSNKTISVLHPPPHPHPHPLCPSPGCASSRQGAKALSCSCLAPGYC